MGKQPACSSDKNGELKRGPWTAEEDKILIDYIQKHGHGKWRTLPKNAGILLLINVQVLTLFVYVALKKTRAKAVWKELQA
ncbi:hypothetical protein Gotur_006278 [Gossypium turneri]